jgi:hypothetical protein
MKMFRCAAFVVIVLGATLAGVCLLDPGQGKGFGSTWEGPGALSGLQREKEELDHLQVLLDHRTNTLTEITAGVIDGRLGLLEAAAAFHAADAEMPSQAKARLEFFAGASEGERECRRVITFVETALEEESSRRATVVERLEAELQAQLQQDGTVRLPVVAGVH